MQFATALFGKDRFDKYHAGAFAGASRRMVCSSNLMIRQEVRAPVWLVALRLTACVLSCGSSSPSLFFPIDRISKHQYSDENTRSVGLIRITLHSCYYRTYRTCAGGTIDRVICNDSKLVYQYQAESSHIIDIEDVPFFIF